jgi:hypothetical protein
MEAWPSAARTGFHSLRAFVGSVFSLPYCQNLDISVIFLSRSMNPIQGIRRTKLNFLDYLIFFGLHRQRYFTLACLLLSGKDDV